MKYEWDNAKNAENLLKHGVDFFIAHDFDWEFAELVGDSRHDYGEERHIATSLIGERVYVMVYTLRGGNIRIISLRKANQREVKRYAEALENRHPNR